MPIHARRRGYLLAALLTGLLSAVALAASDAGSEIEQLLQDNQADRAYALALSRLDRNVGDPRFDMAYARAALAVKRPHEAVFALERVIAREPGNDRARVELARAELALGNVVGAQNALAALENPNPPEPLRGDITALRRQLTPPGRVRAYAELRYGSDRTNDDTSFKLLEIDAPGYVVPTPQVDYQSGAYYGYELGVQSAVAVSPSTSLFGDFVTSGRNNSEDDSLDTRAYDIQAGAATAINTRHALRLALRRQRIDMDLDGMTTFRELSAITPSWTYQASGIDRYALFAQHGRVRYSDDIPAFALLDMDYTLLGAAWTRLLLPRTHVSLSIYGGKQDYTETDVERDNRGWRARLQSGVLSRQLLYVGAGQQRSSGNDDRDDDLTQFEAGWHWNFLRHWTLKTDVVHYGNDSSFDPNDYRRTLGQIGLRYDFF